MSPQVAHFHRPDALAEQLGRNAPAEDRMISLPQTRVKAGD